MESLTFGQLIDLEEKANAGDENARRRLDSMAQEEGYIDWKSQSEELAKMFKPIFDAAFKAVEKGKKRRESTPYVKPIMARLEKRMQSLDPIDRAIAKATPYPSIYEMAKALEQELINQPVNDPDAAQVDGGKADRTIYETMEYYATIIENQQDAILSEQELQNPFYRLVKYLYILGDGNLAKGYKIFAEMQQEEHKRERVEKPVLAMKEDMFNSDNAVHRAEALFTIKGGYSLPEVEAKELMKKMFSEEIAKSAKQLPIPSNTNAGQVIESPKTALPKIEDPTDQRIWELLKEDPSITDTAIAQKLGNLSRQTANYRRRHLEKMGYPVRRVSRQK